MTLPYFNVQNMSDVTRNLSKVLPFEIRFAKIVA